MPTSDAALASPGTPTSSQGNLQSPHDPIVNAVQWSSKLQCSLCDNNFMDNSTLKAHLFEQHCITSFYACALCPTMFLNHTSLEKHLRQDHDLPSPVSCESCDNIFQNQEEMDRHINLCHASSNTCCVCIEDSTPVPTI